MVCGQGGLSGLRRGGITVGGLGMKGQPDGYSVRNIFKVRSLKKKRDQERISLK